MDDMQKLTEFLKLMLKTYDVDILCLSGKSDGYQIKSNALNIRLKICANQHNQVYFQFNYIEDVNHNFVNGTIPIYKSTDVGKTKNLLEIILNHLDNKINRDFAFAPKIVAAFRSYFRNEPVSEEFNIKQCEHSLVMKDSADKIVAFIYNQEIDEIRKSYDIYRPITALLPLTIYKNASATKKIMLYIPQYSLKEYSKLESIYYSQPNATTNFQDIIEQLLTVENVPKNEIQKLASYLTLNTEVVNDGISKDNPKKPKL